MVTKETRSTNEKKSTGWANDPFNKTDHKFSEVEAPDFHTFKKVGDSIQGKLIKRETKKFRNGNGIVYTIQTDGEGTVVRFHGSTIMDDLLNEVPDNAFVRITRQGVGTTSSGQPLHDYKVEVVGE